MPLPTTKPKKNWVLLGFCLVLALLALGSDPIGHELGPKAPLFLDGFLVLAIILAIIWDRKRGL